MLAPPDLPIDPLLPEILAAVQSHHAAVVIAPPGAGKSTRVPPALLHILPPRSPLQVWMLQPRRIAARAIAQRIADESRSPLGREIGYIVRADERSSPLTRLLVMTEGILTRRLLHDPYLDTVATILLDEFHERSLHTDLALALLTEIRQSVRPDLNLVVMSATLDPAPLARYLGNAPIIESPGRLFPISTTYLPPADPRAPVSRRIVQGFEYITKTNVSSQGDILAFLPGVEEIRASARALEPLAARSGHEILLLHGQIPLEEQARVLAPRDHPRIILATNVAETSLTVDGVTTVLDTGLVRRLELDPARGLEALVLGRASLASCDQRTGRAGRTAPGTCIRLWDPRDDRARPRYETPEILRLDLAPVLLTLLAWGNTNPADFPWFEPPPADRLDAARKLLADLGAIPLDARMELTPAGRLMLRIPAHPRLARMLVAAAGTNLEREAAASAALLSEKDLLHSASGPNRQPRQHARSDLLLRLDALATAELARFKHSPTTQGIDLATARRVAHTRDTFLRSMKSLPASPESDLLADITDPEDRLLALLLLAYPDRLARRRAPRSEKGRMVGGRGVRLDPASVVRDDMCFLALDARQDRRANTTEVLVRLASAIDPAWIELLAPDALQTIRTTRFEPERGRFLAQESRHYRDLPLEEPRPVELDPATRQAALADLIAARSAELFAQQPAAQNWLARLDFLRHAMPELDWPAFDPSTLAQVAREATTGAQSWEDARAHDLIPWLASRLNPRQLATLEREAPTHLRIPSGRLAPLAYEPGRPPRLAARVQELFSWKDTPRLAAGRVSLLLEIQGPNHRPVQLTSDLASFWNSTYHQVRKDLRARYPRHAWPEDPWNAQPQARPGRPPRTA